MRRVEAGDASLDGVFRQGRALGRIEVEVRSPDDTWHRVGVYDEAGPIAADRQVIPLPRAVEAGRMELRLRATRGYWRFDELTMAALGERVRPIRVGPSIAQRLDEGEWHPAPDALTKLLDEDAYLATFPGHTYRFEFDLPRGDYELFVESRGYYYEWIREEWLEEESPADAARLMLDFRGTLRRLAPEYERIRPSMEEQFFESRIGEPLDAP